MVAPKFLNNLHFFSFILKFTFQSKIKHKFVADPTDRHAAHRVSEYYGRLSSKKMFCETDFGNARIESTTANLSVFVRSRRAAAERSGISGELHRRKRRRPKKPTTRRRAENLATPIEILPARRRNNGQRALRIRRRRRRAAARSASPRRRSKITKNRFCFFCFFCFFVYAKKKTSYSLTCSFPYGSLAFRQKANLESLRLSRFALSDPPKKNPKTGGGGVVWDPRRG